MTTISLKDHEILIISFALTDAKISGDSAVIGLGIFKKLIKAGGAYRKTQHKRNMEIFAKKHNLEYLLPKKRSRKS